MSEPICRIARWRCKPDLLAETEAANREFVGRIRATEPDTLLYISLQEAGNPTSFLNLMVFASPDSEEAHRTSEAVSRFVDVIYPAAQGEVVFADYRQVATTLG